MPTCLLLLAALALLASGCVRRTMTIQTEPAGALIYLNDEEVGRSEVTLDFTWYGEYDVVARLEGHETLETGWRVKAPWYQWPVVDFFAEVLWPGRIVDARRLDLTLEPAAAPQPEALLENALELRGRALGGEGS